MVEVQILLWKKKLLYCTFASLMFCRYTASIMMSRIWLWYIGLLGGWVGGWRGVEEDMIELRCGHPSTASAWGALSSLLLLYHSFESPCFLETSPSSRGSTMSMDLEGDFSEWKGPPSVLLRAHSFVRDFCKLFVVVAMETELIGDAGEWSVAPRDAWSASAPYILWAFLLRFEISSFEIWKASSISSFHWVIKILSYGRDKASWLCANLNKNV